MQVVGRAEALDQLREAAGTRTRRSSTRANKYALHVKEAYVRALPALFRTAPAADAAGAIRCWCHPLTMDGTATGLALLLSSACPVRELWVGASGQRRRCVLEGGFPVALSPAQVQLAARWLVGCLDLTQAGNAGEPLHASLDVPQRLLLWAHATGTFTANPMTEVPTDGESAALDKFPRTSAWRDHRRTHPDEPLTAAAKQLGASVADIVAKIAERLGAPSADDAPPPPAVVVTMDLDRTIWKGDCLDWPAGSFARYSETSVFDAQANRFLELHVEVPLVLAALEQVRSPPTDPATHTHGSSRTVPLQPRCRAR